MPRFVKHAEHLKRRAEENIQKKLNLLQAWVTYGVPNHPDSATKASNPEYFPTSMRQFKSWTLCENSAATRELYGSFYKTGNDTMAKHPEHSKNALYLISQLKKNSIKKDSTSEIARLTAEIQEIKKILAIRNLEICVAHTQISELKIETERLTRKSNNDRAQYLRSSKKPA